MLNLIQNNKLIKLLSNKIVNNCIFEDNVVFRQRYRGMAGIKLTFRDGTSGILWVYKENKYIFNCEMFDTIVKIPLTTEQGDFIWDKFIKFCGPNKYESKDI